MLLSESNNWLTFSIELISNGKSLASWGSTTVQHSSVELQAIRLTTASVKNIFFIFKLFSDPSGARTQDPYIKSVLLYQLS